MESLAIETLCNALHRDSIGWPHNRDPFRTRCKRFLLEHIIFDSFGNQYMRILLESVRMKSFGKRSNGILLHNVAAGVLWKAPQMDFNGKPHNQNPLQHATKGSC